MARPTPDSVSGTARHRRRRRQHGRHPTSTDPHVITIIAESRQTLVRSHSRSRDVINLINIKEVMCIVSYRIHDLSPGDDVTASTCHIRRTSARATRHGPRSSFHSTYVSTHATVHTPCVHTHDVTFHTYRMHTEKRAHMRHISHGAPAMPLPQVGCGLCTWSTCEASSTPPPLKPPLHVGLPRTLPGLILPVAGDATETSIGHTTAVSRDGSRSTNWRC